MPSSLPPPPGSACLLVLSAEWVVPASLTPFSLQAHAGFGRHRQLVSCLSCPHFGGLSRPGPPEVKQAAIYSLMIIRQVFEG